jgi:HxlR-like helix-turn-helix
MSGVGSRAAAGRRNGPSGVAPAALLADPRAQAILLALADGAHRPCELEQLPGLSRSTLFLRLGELKAIGVVLARELSRFPLHITYALSRTGRVALANTLLGERRQQRMLAAEATATSLSDLLRCLAPICTLDACHDGLCALTERDPRDPAPEPVCLLAAGASITILDEPDTAPAQPTAAIAARPEVWERALVTGSPNGLELDGDHDLAGAVLTGLSLALIA